MKTSRIFISIFTAVFLSFSILSLDAAESDLFQEIPSSYKGRFRPVEATAQLWLNENYGHTSIKSKHINDFHLWDDSALSFLWKLQFCGHANWKNSPLFWVYSSQLKDVLKLPSKENYFCCNDLENSIYQDEKTNLAFVKELAVYQFVKSYSDGFNRTGSEKQELTQLSPGLWAALKNNGIYIMESPSTDLWRYLKKGDQIAEVMSLDSQSIRSKRSFNDESIKILQSLNQFNSFNGPYARSEKEYQHAYDELVLRGFKPDQIEESLNRNFPLAQRLSQAGNLFLVLPAKTGDWLSLNALTVKNFNKAKGSLELVSNFTIYPDEQFDKIQKKYFQLINNHTDSGLKEDFAHLLVENYKSIEGSPVQQANGKSINYPSILQLKTEQFYYTIPLIEATIAVYTIAILFLMVGLGQKRRRYTYTGLFFVLVAFALNTLILALRSYVLARPPVSNMFETVIYVPWVAVFVGLLLRLKMKNSIIVLGASILSLALLILLKVTGLGDSMENVQAVLESQYWLIVHVLMIVGSYGVLALAGILGQIYLIQYLRYKHETYSMQEIGSAILQSIYIGVALLIPGTILGGIWAAQSWGRFWDWDPKESWAFISSCIYLIFIHLYTFKQIRFFGLAMGAVIGLMAISFTWYGVNYILGTGLHSYGFGSGGEIYYYTFLLIQILFLVYVSIIHLFGERQKD